MARPLFDSPYLFGMHDPGGEQHMTQSGKPGWIVFTEAIGIFSIFRGEGLQCQGGTAFS